MIMVEFPNGNKEKIKEMTGEDLVILLNIKNPLAIQVNGEVRDLSYKLTKDSRVKILTFDDQEGKKVLWHTAEHILTQAMLKLFPEKITMAMGPATEEGFYFDFDSSIKFSMDDFDKIEAEMMKIVEANLSIKREQVSEKKARELFKGNKYKQEWIDEFKGQDISVYWTDHQFVDLCAGPHLASTGKVGHIKLLSVAGAYWRGDSKNAQLQRIYGIAFPDKKDLNEYLALIKEAEKRDHRKLGRELDIFEINEDIGPGLVLWLPKGNIIKEELENWAKETEQKWGYVRVTSPLITKEGLFHTSEHLPLYKDSMFNPMDIDGDKYYIKPMNCPFHHIIFKSRPKSYRDLPLRMAEYGWCHRYEQSGAITGLMRVRGMQMNDAHIYCTEDQAVDEFVKVIRLHEYYYKQLGITEYKMELALRDPQNTKYHGEEKMWQKAEDLMMKAMKTSGVQYTVIHSGAAFYGPKIDFQVKSVIGREFSASTNQIDLFMAEKFGLRYTGKDGKEHVPVIIHRAPLGTHERFVGFLIEHFAGKFPVWLSPVQVIIMTVSQRQDKYGEDIKTLFGEAGIRVQLDNRPESIPKKVREAQLQKIPLMLTVGDKEVENNTVALRTLDGQVKFGLKPDTLLKQVIENIKNRELKFSI